MAISRRKARIESVEIEEKGKVIEVRNELEGCDEKRELSQIKKPEQQERKFSCALAF